MNNVSAVIGGGRGGGTEPKACFNDIGGRDQLKKNGLATFNRTLARFTMSKATANQDQSTGSHRDSTASEELTCAMCGSSIVHMIQVARNDDQVDSRCESHGGATTTEANADEHEAEPARARRAKTPHKPTKPSTKRARPKPAIVHSKAVRRAVRQEMLVCIPGFTRARARAVLDASKGGTFAEIVARTPEQLAHVLVAAEPGLAKDPELKASLAKALKRVIQ